MKSVFQDGLQHLMDAMASAGMDTRTWVSYGTVDEDHSDDEGGKAVQFTKDLGPLVRVKLHPLDVIVPCRVATPIAGSLEAEYNPLGPYDEVVVVVPGGTELSFPVIMGRLSNELDQFPEKVAGKETALNNLGFRRTRIPYIVETSSLYMIRSATTGAMLGIDETGNVTIRDGNSNGLQFGPSGFAVQDKDGNGQIVLNSEQGYVSMWYGGTLMKLAGTDGNIACTGNLGIGTAGNTPILHAMAMEQAVHLLSQWIQALSLTLLALGAAPLTGAGLAAVLDPNAAGLALLTAALGMQNTPLLPALVPLVAAVPAGAVSPITPATPGLCCPGLVIG